MNFDQSVFINCPFDEDYAPVLQAILFCVGLLGFSPRVATKRADGGETRLEKIRELIEERRFSIHDLSRCQARRKGEYFRLNMPFELRYGGRDGISSLHLIESALARPYSGYHRAVHRKAAALLHSMVGNHRVIDGNKRTAWLLVEILIARSGYFLDTPDDERIDDLVVAVAEGRIDFDKIAAWFRPRLKQK